ncbi:MAG: hypothetical protein FJ088_04950, partial [Deltaproteobacteria bacterium]|nr:hypothetical protein [Deltaproteobacteria bacterium]
PSLGGVIFFPDNATSIVKIEGLTPDDPTFPVFGRRLQRLVAMFGLGVEIIPGALSIGAGLTILSDITGSVESLAPISVFNPDNPDNPPPPQPSSAVFKQDLDTETAFNFGALFSPAEWLSLAVVRRGGMTLNLDFDVEAGISINFGSPMDAMIPYTLQSNFFYIPEQYVFGAKFMPFKTQAIMLDIAWMRTGNLEDNLPITKFHIKEEALGGDGQVRSLENIGKFRVTNEVMPEVKTRDIIVPRIGIEQKLLGGMLDLRAGYSYHQSPFESNQGYENFLLDNSFHSLTFGAGLNFKDPSGIFPKPLTFSLHFQTLILNPHYNRVGKSGANGNYIGKGVVETGGYFIGGGATLTMRF